MRWLTKTGRPVTISIYYCFYYFACENSVMTSNSVSRYTISKYHVTLRVTHFIIVHSIHVIVVQTTVALCAVLDVHTDT